MGSFQPPSARPTKRGPPPSTCLAKLPIVFLFIVINTHLRIIYHQIKPTNLSSNTPTARRNTHKSLKYLLKAPQRWLGNQCLIWNAVLVITDITDLVKPQRRISAEWYSHQLKRGVSAAVLNDNVQTTLCSYSTLQSHMLHTWNATLLRCSPWPDSSHAYSARPPATKLEPLKTFTELHARSHNSHPMNQVNKTLSCIQLVCQFSWHSTDVTSQINPRQLV